MADGPKIREALIKAAEQVDQMELDRSHMEREVVCLLKRLGGSVVLTDEELVDAEEHSFIAYEYADGKGTAGRFMRVTG